MPQGDDEAAVEADAVSLHHQGHHRRKGGGSGDRSGEGAGDSDVNSVSAVIGVMATLR